MGPNEPTNQLTRWGMVAKSQARADEARELVQGLLDSGWTIERVAADTGVSSRTIYRWWSEGRAPLPAFMISLRKLAAGVAHGDTSM